MVICICSFTQKGRQIEEKLKNSMKNVKWVDRITENSLKKWTSEVFFKRLPIVFVGATGIAVRTIAEFVNDKLTDSPVIVIDEKAQFVIPILSGHVGGGNKLAVQIAKALGAQPVITTATDIENKFSVDVFAYQNGLRIVNREGIKKVSSKLLNDEIITLWKSPELTALDLSNHCSRSEIKFIEDAKMPNYADIIITSPDFKEPVSTENNCLIHLEAKIYSLGIGCKKGKSFYEIKDFLEKNLTKEQLEKCFAISSIDIKSEEIGLMEIAQFFHLPFITYSANELETVEGDFAESDFVKQKTGTGNVCERAAVKSAGNNSELCIRKISGDGITLALAKKKF